MSFLDENIEKTLPTDPKFLKKVKDATDKAEKGDSTDLALVMNKLNPSATNEKKGKDLDGDGDIDSDDYLAARDAAIKRAKAKAKKKMNEEDLEEGRLKNFILGLGLGAAALAGLNKMNDNDPVVKRLKAEYETTTDATKKDSIEDLISKRLIMLDTGEFDDSTPIKEDKQIKVDANQKFVIDLKHLLQKHGHDNTIKITKKLMKKLHDKGEVEVDGTKLLFKEADIPQDTSVDLPEPKSNDFLGPDGKDYEGGMAKSQMLKMKKYAMALCDMVDDETQLEAWVQSKITKASDYMSSVYHYLDYQKTKMNESTINGKKVDLKSLEGEDNMFTYAEFMDGTKLTDDELDQLSDDPDALDTYFGPGGVGHIPRSDFI